MTQSPNTKTTQPQDDPRSHGAVIDGECYIKSTIKASTWEVSSHKIKEALCPAVDGSPNSIDHNNIDWDLSGMYGGFTGSDRPVKMGHGQLHEGGDVLPLGDDSYKILTDWSLNPNMIMGVDDTTNQDQWQFQYNNESDGGFPYTTTFKPKMGSYYQYLIKFKSPIDLPVNSTIHWWWNHQNEFTGDGGASLTSTGTPYNYGLQMSPGEPGGFFTEPNINRLPVAKVELQGSVCGLLPHFKNPDTDWKNKGLRDVHYMVVPNLMSSCGPVSNARNGPANFRQLALGFTSLPEILTEGIDF